MILKACLTLSDPARSCQVSAELELDNQVTPEILSTRTSELLLGLQSGITNAVSGSTLKNVTPATNPPALAAAGANNKVILATLPERVEEVQNENVTPPANPLALAPAEANKNVIPANQETLPTGFVAPKRKTRVGAPPSEKQLSYLNYLLTENGLSLAKWCKERNARKDQITKSQCQQWIPELLERQKKGGWPT